MPDQESWNVEITLTDEGIMRALVKAGHLEKYNEKNYIFLNKNVDVDFFDEEEVHTTNLKSFFAEIDERTKRFGHEGGIIWFTGLSGSGKSTLAKALERKLFDKGYNVYMLDADNVRDGLNSNLGFSNEDRNENIRRAGEVSSLFAEAGFIVLSAFISPFHDDRQRAFNAHPKNFHEVYLSADLSTCEDRDPKGLYKKARAGEIKEFTGIDSPYEIPKEPSLIIDTKKLNIDESTDELFSYIVNKIPVR